MMVAQASLAQASESDQPLTVWEMGVEISLVGIERVIAHVGSVSGMSIAEVDCE